MASQMDALLSALADPTRRRIVDLLVEKPRRAGELVAEFTSAAPTISRHLRVLRDSGLVEATGTADARVRVYRLRAEPFGDLGAWVDQVQAHWRSQLESFAAHVERVAAATSTESEGTDQ